MSVLLVNSESPASIAGLKVGDVILKLNGIEVNNIQDFNRALASFKPGEQAFVTVSRYGEVLELPVMFQ